ncbi:thiamine-phosphate kinase [Actinomycetospora endophytica]|uniref:thiamine-phosphate kinase n=1 Tax=Actinomycetospora endophytica TaxID=2291215 RepID=UPI0027E25325|nr:thiamine-phosphate kinase [Actinomycetospora endophytica]
MSRTASGDTTKQDGAGRESAGGGQVSDLGEFGVIDRITADRPQPDGTLLGPGDDAAVVAAPDGRVVATVDTLVQGVHFRLDWSGPEQVGRKAVAANLADVAAMGAIPTALLLSLACPASTSTEVVDGLAAGIWDAASEAGVGVVGGDTVSADQIVVSITALGDLEGRAPVRRSGAKVGDVVAVRGVLGWSAAGMEVLRRGFRSPVAMVAAHRTPRPPFTEGPVAARAGATAMVDTSDGLLADLGHIAAASRVRIDVRSELVPVADKLRDVASALGKDALAWALTGGEDHALVACFREEDAVPDGWTVCADVRLGTGVSVDADRWGGAGDPGWRHWR